MATTYDAGEGLLVGSGSVWLLVDDVPDAVVVERWLEIAQGGSGAVDRLLAAVESHYAGTPGALAVLDTTPGAERSVVRGRGAVTADGDARVLDVGLTGRGPVLPLVAGAVAAASARVDVPARGSAPGIIDGIPPEVMASTRPPTPVAPAPQEPRSHTVARVDGRRAAPPVTYQPDHDGHTSMRTDAHLRQSTHETVLAALCVSFHPTPPHAPTCRVCGAPVLPQEPQRVPRPVLGRLVLPTGEWVGLDRGAVFGRKPAPLADGESWPHLVTLPGDSTYLSRVHLEVRLDGWLVLARDLGSQGGTTLKVPGRPPQRIRANEPHVLEAGHVLDLADVYEIRFEVSE